MGFGQGLSGLNAAAQNLDVIGNNIANSKTAGFKASSMAFADVYANSRVGMGVQVAAINQRFTAGNVELTGNQFDMAIDGEKGFFRLLDTSGMPVYSRNGQFHQDKDFYITNAQGFRLTGYQVRSDGTLSDQLGPLRVPSGNIDPRATDAIDISANLDANATPVDDAVQFDPANSSSYTHSLPITVYDSLGNSHTLMQYYIKREPDNPQDNSSVWEVRFVLEDNVLADVETLEFSPSGTLLNDPAYFDLTIPSSQISSTSPADDLEIRFDYDGSTQFGGEFNPKFTQNGYPTGEYSSMSVSKDGSLVASYTNGVTRTIGAVALADFNNPNGLQPIGDNAFAETGESGQPVLGLPGSQGLATIKGQSVEASNVDLSAELVNMIIAQRTYQANAQTIKTQDQIMQTLITLR